jgi:hypothetical protein
MDLRPSSSLRANSCTSFWITSYTVRTTGMRLQQRIHQPRRAALEARLHQQAKHIDAGHQQKRAQQVAHGLRRGDAQANEGQQPAEGALGPQPAAQETQRPRPG